jgi:phosphatidylserine/phosphatidylglycerophosphate/cardiolipin synthase-like enzyme
MHDKYMVIDGKTLYSGSYNLSDNSEHGTFENMVVFHSPAHSPLVAKFEADFESIWKTGHDEGKLDSLLDTVDHASSVPLVFDPIALTWNDVTNLKQHIRTSCSAADSTPFRQNVAAHQTCSR